MIPADSRRTPWQKVFARLGMSRAELARALGRHRSKVSRNLRDSKGLISGRDQELIVAVARQSNVKLTPSDMVPDQ